MTPSASRQTRPKDIASSPSTFIQQTVRRCFQEEFLEGIHYGRELAEISKCHNNESLVLLNIRRVHLIKLDLSNKVRRAAGRVLSGRRCRCQKTGCGRNCLTVQSHCALL